MVGGIGVIHKHEYKKESKATVSSIEMIDTILLLKVEE